MPPKPNLRVAGIHLVFLYDYEVVTDLEPTSPSGFLDPFAVLWYLSYCMRHICYVALSSKFKCCTFLLMSITFTDVSWLNDNVPHNHDIRLCMQYKYLWSIATHLCWTWTTLTCMSKRRPLITICTTYHVTPKLRPGMAIWPLFHNKWNCCKNADFKKLAADMKNITPTKAILKKI